MRGAKFSDQEGPQRAESARWRLNARYFAYSRRSANDRYPPTSAVGSSRHPLHM
jgi:hypothetical protein